MKEGYIMIILGSYGFRQTTTGDQIGALLPDKKANVLIIPLASETPMIAGKKEKEGIIHLGFEDTKITIYTRSDHEMIVDKNYDIIVVPGGNTFKLLHLVKEYSLDEYIKRQYALGCIYIGLSAGAYLACPDVGYVSLFDDNNYIKSNDFSALALTGKYPICHYESKGLSALHRCEDYFTAHFSTVIPEYVPICDGDIFSFK